MKSRLFTSVTIRALLLSTICTTVGLAVTYSVNVTLPTASLQSDFIANATAYFQGTLSKSAFFLNTYSVVVTSKNVVGPVVIPAPSFDNCPCYVYGWADGAQRERDRDLATIHNYELTCGTMTCHETLANASNDIYQQNFSTPLAH